MNEFLVKDEIVFQRGEDGKILPQEAVLTGLDDKPKIKYLPITFGKFQALKVNALGETSKEQDIKIIVDHCLNPQLTKEEVEIMKPHIASAIVLAIISGSIGITEEKLKEKSLNKIIASKEFELKKK